jgi:hypothetical protein
MYDSAQKVPGAIEYADSRVNLQGFGEAPL